MNRVWISFIVLSLVIASGCSSSAVSTNPKDYEGEYIFKPSNASTEQFATFIILRSGQSAVEIRYSQKTGQVQTTEGRWYLEHGTDEEVVIGNRAYPIHRSGSTIRLTINEVGQYYEKIR